MQKRDESETRQKIAAVAEGPLPVVSIRGNMVVIRRVDESVERVSCDRVVLTPSHLTAEVITVHTGPFTDEELIAHGKPIESRVNLSDIISSPAVQPGGVTTGKSLGGRQVRTTKTIRDSEAELRENERPKQGDKNDGTHES